MSTEDRREHELRRLLAEAVKPVEPGPGAQTRLLARARSQAQRKRRHPAGVLRWAVPVTIVSLALIFAVTFGVIAGRNDRGASKGASTAAGSASVSAPEGASSRAAAAAGPSGTPDATLMQPAVPSPLTANSGSGTSLSSEQNGKAATDQSLVPSDLDGDGRVDSFAINAGKLQAMLSTDGAQTVELPEVGAGARVLGMAFLTDPSGNTVRALFVRLNVADATPTDTIATVVSGHLTVVQKGSGPVLLTIDAGHGYGCSQGSLVVSGDTTPYVIDGSRLVASPQLRAVLAPAGKTSGCY